MARVDDYIHAIKISAESLSLQPSDLLSSQAGFEMTEPAALRIPFLDRVYRLEYPGFAFSDESQPGKQIPLQEQVLILHYLQGKHKPGISSKWIAYREIPGASFYFSAFVKRAIDPLKKTFGANIAGLIKAAGVLSGKKSDTGDAGFEFQVFPNIALRVILWSGDEEFPPEANILFQDSICDILSPEDSAWLAGMLVYRLIAISYR